MKPHPTILMLGLACAALSVAAADDAVLRFSNKDLLAGSMESLSSDLLVWNSPVLEKPTPFFLRNVIDVSLPATFPDVVADHVATLTLTNGDTVLGQLASVTDEVISLDTWFAGRMNFNRLMVSGLKIGDKSGLLYRGPTGLDGWKQSGAKPAWKYSRSAFVSNAAGSIARDKLLPDECSVSFDMAKKNDSFSFKVILFSDDPSSESSSGYEISFQRGGIQVRNSKTSFFMGSTQSQAMLEYDKVRIELRASWKSGKICLYVNHRLVEVWTDPDVAKGRFGRCLHFVSQNTLPLRISGIEVAPWDGVAPTPEPRVGMMRQFGFPGLREDAKPSPQEKPKEGRMELANGDSLEGEVNSIQEGMISVKTPLGDIKIPVARLRTVALKKVDLERCIRRNGDVRASFPDGSSLVFRFDGVADGTLTGSSQNFGSATFKISAFSRIEFNIHEPAFEDQRSGEDW